MLGGSTIGLHQRNDSGEHLVVDPMPELHDEEAGTSGEILYHASFKELSGNNLQYDTLIWVMISLLLVLAWGVGLFMLLYLPFRRYVMREEIASRTLYVTKNKIVYKASRPSFVPFLGMVKIEKQIPLHLVVDIIIEQGCLQSAYGLCTVRVESKAHHRAASLEELQFQGVCSPDYLQKVIIHETAKCFKKVHISKPAMYSWEGLSATKWRSLTEFPSFNRLQSPNMKVGTPSHRRVNSYAFGDIPCSAFLEDLDQVNRSLKKIESLLVRVRPETSKQEYLEQAKS